MARPRKAQHEKKSRQVIFRLTESDYLRLADLARQSNLTPNELARQAAQLLEGRLVVRTYRQLDPAYIAQVRRIGLNLNTLVKNAHYFKRASPKLEELADDIRRIVIDAVKERVER